MNYLFTWSGVRRAVAICAVVVCLGSFASISRAEDVPKFSAPEVNAFVEKFNKLVDEMAAATQASDAEKTAAVSEKMTTLMGTEGPSIDAKLTSEERPRFEKYIGDRMKVATGQ